MIPHNILAAPSQFFILLQLIANVFSQTPVSLPVQMSRNEFNQIVRRECINELSNIIEGRDRMWKQKSRKYFKSGRSCKYQLFDADCTMPFLVCDSTPGYSGYERKAILRKLVLDNTPTKKHHLVGVEDIPMYNGKEMTCYSITMVPKTARILAQQECQGDPCVIQSFIPMMKLSYGTVDLVQQSVDNRMPSLSVMAEISPHYKDKKGQIILHDLVELTVKSGQTRKRCRQHLYDTFPSTGQSYDSCQIVLSASDVDAFWLSNSVVSFSISLSISQSPEMSKEKVFRFIASLAVRPEILSIEVSESYYIF